MGGAMNSMGSSGSGDIGGLTERRPINSNNLLNNLMNAESGSTAEFTNGQRFYHQNTNNMMQQVFSSPPSTS